MMQSLREVVEMASLFPIPLLIVGVVVWGMIKGVPVYEQFVEGAKEGFRIAVIIIPYLVAIIFAIGMFRASGAEQFVMDGLRPLLSAVGIPPEILPMAIVRPLTGGGSIAVLSDMVDQHGHDSMITRIAATISGATETTFYVIAVYFGAVNIRKTRHALPAGLISDFAAILLAVYVVKLLFSS